MYSRMHKRKKAAGSAPKAAANLGAVGMGTLVKPCLNIVMNRPGFSGGSIP